MMERERDPIVRGGLLCDEMGLGKTFSTIGLLLNSPVSKTLLMGPIAVLDQWKLALKPSKLAVYEVGSKGQWVKVFGKPLMGSVYLVNYDKLLTKKILFTGHWDRLVCDEAHNLRNSNSKRFEQMKTIVATCKWFLTGTPVVNSTSDLASLMHLLNRSIRLYKPSEATAVEWMGRYALARTVEQIRDALPNVIPKDPEVFHHRLDFSTEDEANFYRGIQGRLSAELQELLGDDNPNMIMILNLILNLRQISTHPQVYIESRRRKSAAYRRANWDTTSTKIKALQELLASEKKSHGYVIFCHFHDEMDILKQYLEKDSNVGQVFMYSGSMTPAQRTAVVEKTIKAREFATSGADVDTILQTAAPHLPLLPRDILNFVLGPMVGGRHTILLAQMQSAGTGINLQHMDRVVFLSPWWTAALMDQCVGRVVRLGQTKVVHVHHLAFNEEETVSLNIDDYINERVEKKREVCERMLNAANHAYAPM